jgi:hypothetical protein
MVSQTGLIPTQTTFCNMMINNEKCSGLMQRYELNQIASSTEQTFMMATLDLPTTTEEDGRAVMLQNFALEVFSSNPDYPDCGSL